MIDFSSLDYPRLSLPDAVEKINRVYSEEQLSPMTREVMAEHMGYSGINGASLKALAAVRKYGLIEGRAEQLRVSKDAQILILDPPDSMAFKKIAQSKALEPALFRALNEHFDGVPTERNLTSFLEKQGFRRGAAKLATKFYSTTMAYADITSSFKTETNIDSVNLDVGNEDFVTERENMSLSDSQKALEPSPTILPAKRLVGRYEFENGGFVEIAVGGDVDMTQALGIAENLISMKKVELSSKLSQE